MTLVWTVLFLLWAYIVIFNDNLSTVSWWFLFLLWVGIACHYSIVYRYWKKEMNLRRQERRERVRANQEMLSESLEGEYVPSPESKRRV